MIIKPFRLSARSYRALEGIHPDLVKVVEFAIQLTDVDFVVLEGARTVARQRELYNKGASTTMNSRHITGPDGFAKAVDLGAWIGTVRWDWPLYYRIAAAMKKAAVELSVPIIWGGDWKTFKDGPHFELSRKEYP